MCAYDGLTAAGMTGFGSREAAIARGYETSVFRDEVHAANAYEECKRIHQAQHSSEMWAHSRKGVSMIACLLCQRILS